MTCTSCDKAIADDAAFCPYCGTKLPDATNDQEERQLRRPRNGRLLAGVCAGMADYFGGTALAFRIGFVLMTIITAGLLAIGYAALAIIIPNE